MATMTGKEALAQMLAAEGLNYIFGKPRHQRNPLPGRTSGLPQPPIHPGPPGRHRRGHGRRLRPRHRPAGLCQHPHRRRPGQRHQRPLQRLPGRHSPGAHRRQLGHPDAAQRAGTVRRPGGDDPPVHQVECRSPPRRQHPHGGPPCLQGGQDAAHRPGLPLLSLGHHGRGGGR